MIFYLLCERVFLLSNNYRTLKFYTHVQTGSNCSLKINYKVKKLVKTEPLPSSHKKVEYWIFALNQVLRNVFQEVKTIFQENWNSGIKATHISKHPNSLNWSKFVVPWCIIHMSHHLFWTPPKQMKTKNKHSWFLKVTKFDWWNQSDVKQIFIHPDNLFFLDEDTLNEAE